jgi:hypothetical protein
MADPGTILAILSATASVVDYLQDVARTLKSAPDSLAKVVTEAQKLRMQLDRFHIISKDFSPESRQYLDKQVSTAECLEVVSRLEALTIKIKPGEEKMKSTERFKWLLNKSLVEGLVQDLNRETQRLTALLPVEQLFKQDDQIARLLEMMSKLAAQKQQPATTVTFDSNGIFSPYTAEGIAWYGQFRCKPGQDFKMPYFRDRKALAAAVYYGRFDQVFQLLKRGRDVHHQKWINTVRICKLCLSCVGTVPD